MCFMDFVLSCCGGGSSQETLVSDPVKINQRREFTKEFIDFYSRSEKESLEAKRGGQESDEKKSSCGKDQGIRKRGAISEIDGDICDVKQRSTDDSVSNDLEKFIDDDDEEREQTSIEDHPLSSSSSAGRKKNMEGFCSWCFKKSTHEFEKYRLLKKNAYHCLSCANKTMPCNVKECQGFCRDYVALGCEKKCYKCLGLIDSWVNACDDHLNLHRKWCSWCFHETDHRGYYLKGNLYECKKCENPTMPCKFNCYEGMARSGLEDKCAVCCKLIDNWENEEENIENLKVTTWCSSCVDKTGHVLLKKRKWLRDVYRCTKCSCDGFFCKSCKECITSASKCLRCMCEDGRVKMNWEDLIERRHELEEKSTTLTSITAELSKTSEYKERALEAGLIRPFLFMVSMSPSVRYSLASALKMNLFIENCFGDSHAESWLILNKNRKGIIARSKGPCSTVFGRTLCWQEILRAVNGLSFKDSRLTTGCCNCKVDFENGNDYNNTYELYLLEDMALNLRANMDDLSIAIVNEMCNGPRTARLFNSLQGCGLRNNDSLKRFIVELLFRALVSDSDTNMIGEECTKPPSNLQSDLYDKKVEEHMSKIRGKFLSRKDTQKFLAGIDPDTVKEMSSDVSRSLTQKLVTQKGYFQSQRRAGAVAGAVGKITIMSTLIHPFLPVLYPFALAFNIGSKVLASDCESLYPVISLILLQRLFLSTCKISIDQHYELYAN